MKSQRQRVKRFLGASVSAVMMMGCIPMTPPPSQQGQPTGAYAQNPPPPAQAPDQPPSPARPAEPLHAVTGPGLASHPPIKGGVATSTDGPYYGLTPGRPGIAIDRAMYYPGQTMQLYVTGSSGFKDNAWVGIVPSEIPHGQESVNDKYDLAYKHIHSKTYAHFTFRAPTRPGRYDFRLNSSDSGGIEVAYISFTVFDYSTVSNPTPPPPADYRRPTITPDKEYYQPGETMTVKFTAFPEFRDNAWIGLVPPEIPHGQESRNDRYDMGYKHLKGLTSGTVTFRLPYKPGRYDLRMNDNDSNGYEVAYKTIVVFDTSDGPNPNPAPPADYRRPTLSLDRTVYHPGETITVKFKAYPFYKDNAWIGIVPSDIPHGSESRNDRYDLGFQHLKGRVQGTMTFKAPGPGRYDMRMNDDDSNGREVTYVSFTVK